mgnify:CR=1 FL=1
MLNSAAKVNARIGSDSTGCGVKAKLISPAALAKNTIDRASVSRFFMAYKINWLQSKYNKKTPDGKIDRKSTRLNSSHT